MSKEQNMTHAICYFVCGTLADRKGFEHVALGPGSLPDKASSYLDVSPTSFSEESYTLSRLTIGGTPYVSYARYRGINPSDKGLNRGAYLAVGFLVARKMSMHAVSQCIEQVARISSDLNRHLGADNAFAPGFDLSKYAFPAIESAGNSRSELSPVLLTDLTIQAINADGAFEAADATASFLPSEFTNVGSADEDLHYFSAHKNSTRHTLDKERENLRMLAERVVVASNRFGDMHKRWLKLEGLAVEGAKEVVNSSKSVRALVKEISSRTALAQSLATSPQLAPSEPTPAYCDAPTPASSQYPLTPAQTDRRAARRTEQAAAPTVVSRESSFDFGAPSPRRKGGGRSAGSRAKSRHKGGSWLESRGTQWVAGVVGVLSVVAIAVIILQGDRGIGAQRAQATKSQAPVVRPVPHPHERDSRSLDDSVARERAALDEDLDKIEKTETP